MARPQWVHAGRRDEVLTGAATARSTIFTSSTASMISRRAERRRSPSLRTKQGGWLAIKPELCFRYSASNLHQNRIKNRKPASAIRHKSGSLVPLFRLLKAELSFRLYLEKRKSGALKAEVSRHKSGSWLPPNPLKNPLKNTLSLYRSSDGVLMRIKSTSLPPPALMQSKRLTEGRKEAREPSSKHLPQCSSFYLRDESWRRSRFSLRFSPIFTTTDSAAAFHPRNRRRLIVNQMSVSAIVVVCQYFNRERFNLCFIGVTVG